MKIYPISRFGALQSKGRPDSSYLGALKFVLFLITTRKCLTTRASADILAYYKSLGSRPKQDITKKNSFSSSFFYKTEPRNDLYATTLQIIITHRYKFGTSTMFGCVFWFQY